MEFKYQFASKRVFDKLYKTHNLIEKYQNVIGSEEYEEIVQNLMYTHDRLQKLYKYYDYIYISLKNLKIIFPLNYDLLVFYFLYISFLKI